MSQKRVNSGRRVPVPGGADGASPRKLQKPKAHKFERTRIITNEDVAWVATYLVPFVQLLEKTDFRLAVDSFCLHNQLANRRAAATILWSGIEALFHINTELRFRLAACIAATLEDRGAGRTDCYRRIKRLYDFRSRLVHGADAADVAVVEHIVEVRKILSRLICRYTEAGEVHNESRIEQLLFA